MYSQPQRGPLRLALFVLIVSLIIAGSGCGGGGGGPRGDLTGTVTDVDGRSVAGANVSSGFHSATSLSNGTFTMSGLKEGFQTITATVDVKGHRWSGQTVVDLVGAYQNRSTNIVISDERYQASLGGAVIDPNGFGLEGAKVFIGGPFGSTMAVTDGNGNYQADRLTPSTTYTVTASLAGFKNDTRTVHLDPNQNAALSFALTAGSNSGTLPAPAGVTAQSWTLADTVTRVAQYGQKGTIFDWLKHFYRHKRGLPDGPVAKMIEHRPTGRLSPAGSVVEVDLFWTYASDPQLFGYAIKRGLSASASPGAEITAILRDPLSSAFFDVDPLLTPNVSYTYTVHSLDTVKFPADGTIGTASAPITADPFSPIGAVSPINGAGASGTPLFKWSAVNGAAAYQLYVWDEFPTLMFDPSLPNEPGATQPIWPVDPSHPGNALITAPATSASYQGPALQAGHTYYWLVVALDSTNPANVATLSASQISKFMKQ